MIKDIDIFKTEKEVPNYKYYLLKSLEEFKEQALKWADKNNYPREKYILSPTLTWTKEKPFILKYTLEIKQYIKE
jgi:hypothetical protein